ncbi:hypothetical protein [Sphingomonas sp.]|uniref:hypothetical protein n=1 Tax=Sphingomonas sp. TaxID=28214 RepID=UPI002FDA53C0
MVVFSELYGGYEISWRETGEQFVALVRLPREERPPALIRATVSEGMSVLKSRTRAAIDAGEIERYRPTL